MTKVWVLLVAADLVPNDVHVVQVFLSESAANDKQQWFEDAEKVHPSGGGGLAKGYWIEESELWP